MWSWIQVGLGLHRHQGITKVDNCGTSNNYLCHFFNRRSGNSSYQSMPAVQISCIRIFALTVNGDRNCKGLNKVPITLNTFLSVCFTSWRGGSTLNENTSLTGFHRTPRVLTVGVLSLLNMTVESLSLGRTSSTTLISFDDHLGSPNSALSKSSESWRRSSLASSTVSAESRTSSTYIEYTTVSAVLAYLAE